MFGFPDRNRNDSFFGFPDRRVSNELFFGFPSGNEIYDFRCDSNTANFAFSMTLRTEMGARVVIDKGDGSYIVNTGTGADQTISWTYTQVNKYNIVISGETDRIQRLAITGRRLFGNLQQSTIDKLPNIVDFDISNNQFTGTLPSFEACTSLSNFQCHNNQFTGTLPSFEACTSLSNF